MEFIKLFEAVARKTQDNAEIVQKTAKKLILELKKCYPQLEQVVKNGTSGEVQNICLGVIYG